MKKVLLVRFSSIGDIVLTTPLPRILRNNGIEVHYLTKKQFLPLLQNNPHIHKIITIDESVSEVARQLRNEKYYRVLDLHRNIRSASLLLRLRRPFRRIRKLNLRKWVLVNLKINFLPKLHVVDRYLETARGIATYDGLGLEYFIPASEAVDIARDYPELQAGYYCLTVGSLHFTKQIPVELARSIIAAIKHPVVLLGGSDDYEKASKISASCPESRVINQCGKLSINQSASFIMQSKALITSDTGLMHIACALKKRVISIWGNTVPEFGMSPYYPQGLEHLGSVVQVPHLKCRPCSKLGFNECPKGHFRCMMDIQVSQIVHQLSI